MGIKGISFMHNLHIKALHCVTAALLLYSSSDVSSCLTLIMFYISHTFIRILCKHERTQMLAVPVPVLLLILQTVYEQHYDKVIHKIFIVYCFYCLIISAQCFSCLYYVFIVCCACLHSISQQLQQPHFPTGLNGNYCCVNGFKGHQ